MNPLLPENCFVPDAEARVMPDGRLYIYGSWDRSGAEHDDYCSHELHCFSTDDMEHWTDHGEIFRNTPEHPGLPWRSDVPLFAPDAIEKDGKYYLYLCAMHRKEGVAVADSPIGPFAPAEKIEIADGDGIDPSIFVDDDGQAYYFWGQFTLRGAKLADDMKTILPETVTQGLLTEWEHGFHEGASLRKRGNKYYMVYTDISRGKATCMSYAMADSPLGPYKKGGVIVDNIGCDPQTWNNHGSIAEYRGQWYVFYHRSSQNRNTCRRVCAEPIFFEADGSIREVEQTSQGPSAPMNAFEPIRARRTCRMMGKCYVDQLNDREVLVSKEGGHWRVPDWAEYKYVDFGSADAESTTAFRILASGKGKISVKVDGNESLSTVEIDSDNIAWHVAPCKNIDGVKAMWLHLEGNMTIDAFCFDKE